MKLGPLRRGGSLPWENTMRFAGLCLLFGVVISSSVIAAGSRTEEGEALVKSLLRSPSVVLLGWAEIHDELMLYSSENSFKGEKKVECISVVFSSGVTDDIRKLNGHKVEVTGSIIYFYDLQYSKNDVMPQKMYNGSPVSNYCLGKFIIIGEEVREVDRPKCELSQSSTIARPKETFSAWHPIPCASARES